METITGKTILYAYGYLEHATQKLDELMLSRALAAGTPDKGGGTAGGMSTYEQVDKILDLVNKKIRLVNLKVIVDETLNRLSYEEQLILKMRYVQGLKFEYFGDILKYTKRTYFRRIDSALKKFCTELKKQGYDDSWFEREYINQKWIKNLRHRLERPVEDAHPSDPDDAGVDWQSARGRIKAPLHGPCGLKPTSTTHPSRQILP